MFDMVNSTILMECFLSKGGGYDKIDDVKCFGSISGFVVLFGCGGASERPISQGDIPELIGKWEGRYNFSVSGFPELIRVEIFNDSLEGNISASTNPRGKSCNGKIEDGRLVVSWEKDCWIKMKLRKDGRDIRLVGNIQTPQAKETFTLEKIKQ